MGKPEPRERCPALEKQAWKPGTLLAPVPVVLVSCGGGPAAGGRANILTVAWAGTVCSEPPMLSISVRPERHSYGLIKAGGEFAVNLPTVRQAKAVDWCGVKSGREFDKFAETGLTPAPARKLKGTPVIAECPVNLECRVRRALELGSHVLFVAEIVAVQVAAELVDAKGRLRLDKAELLAYSHGDYFTLGRRLGHFGFSVRKPGCRRR
ncbi:MAG: flavin reductase family protein [Lentisphaeria bacterium]|jgi:flavin reductase (DIM6/NTAB) family NADH-FMN oxidoreductase RutF